MMARAAVLLLGLVAVVTGTTNMAVLKELGTDNIKLNEDVQVTFTLFNLGDEAATDVRVMDVYWPDSFSDVMGVRDFSFAKIAPQTNVTHTFVVKATEEGTFNVPSARVIYKGAEDDSQL